METEGKTDTSMIVGGALVVAALAASVVLKLADKDTAIVMTIIGPVVSALFVTGYVKGVTGQQNGILEKAATDVKAVRRQTNGVLDQRIKEQTAVAIREELAAAGVIPTEPGENAGAPPAPAPDSEGSRE